MNSQSGFSSGQIDYRLLAARISEKRKREGLGVREAAEQCGGISYSTLNRLERGTAKPDVETLTRLLGWLDISPSSLLMGTQPIRAHLRAQKNLASPVAEALAEVVRAAQARYYLRSPQDRDMEAPASSKGERVSRVLRSSLREEFAARLRKSIHYDLDTPLNPFDLDITAVQVRRVDEIPNVPERTLELLVGAYRASWSAITLPLNDAESEWLIVLNSSDTVERQRATLMEENCHILLGHHLTTLSHIEGQTFRDYNKTQEADAYGLGAAILVPKAALLARVERGEVAQQIAAHFGVSPELIEYRIKVTGAWYQYKLEQHVKTRPSDARGAGYSI